MSSSSAVAARKLQQCSGEGQTVALTGNLAFAVRLMHAQTAPLRTAGLVAHAASRLTASRLTDQHWGSRVALQQTLREAAQGAGAQQVGCPQQQAEGTLPCRSGTLMSYHHYLGTGKQQASLVQRQGHVSSWRSAGATCQHQQGQPSVPWHTWRSRNAPALLLSSSASTHLDASQAVVQGQLLAGCNVAPSTDDDAQPALRGRCEALAVGIAAVVDEARLVALQGHHALSLVQLAIVCKARRSGSQNLVSAAMGVRNAWCAAPGCSVLQMLCCQLQGSTLRLESITQSVSRRTM